MDSAVVEVDGSDGPITVRRDEWGIPHVRATTAHDAFFGQGFVQAEDRLGQLELDRRRAYGRWAEVAGSTAVPFDVFTRRLGLRDAARREYDHLSPPARQVLDAFAAGINAFLALGRPLPTDLALAGLTPEPWSPWDANAIFLVRHVIFANWQKKLWRARVAEALGVATAVRLETDDRTVPLVVPPGAGAPPYGLDPSGFATVRWATAMLRALDPGLLGVLDAPGDGGPSAEEPGSNAWVVAGHRTASGSPLLAGDPHRQVEVPGVYVQNHLACDEFDALGLAFVGVPGFPHFGHNAEVAWCVTNAYGDYQDLYVERFPDGCAPDRVEVVHQRDGTPVPVECFVTPNGPVVFGDPRSGVGIAMQSSALVAPSSGLEVLAPMLRARSAESLRAVMRDWVDPVNNLLCADRSGEILYQTVGSIPIRTHANACGPVPGWTPGHGWAGVVPYDDLPSVRNPESGVIVTANQRIVGPDYPHHLSDGYSRPDRAERVLQRLAGLEAATVDDMAAIHRDVASLRAPLWIGRLTALTPTDVHERAALDLLGDWDGEVRTESGAAAVYMAVRDAVCRNLVDDARFDPLRASLRDEPPSAFVPPTMRLWPVVSSLLAADDPSLLAPGEDWDDVLGASLTRGVAMLRDRCGDDPDQWRWGALHVSAPTHPLSPLHPEWGGRLDPPAVEMSGEWDTVFATSHAAGLGFAVTGASVARYVFDLADWDRGGWIVPLGASGDCTSPHFADQRTAWAAGDLVPMRYSWPVIEEHASAPVTLVPRTQ
ncbi:MAG: penicillin acylase family protein [Actinomycetota bacterium]